MSVTIIITESQKRKLLLESSGEKFKNIVEKGYKLTKKVLSDASSQIGMDLKFLVTWGASIGGFIGPIEDFVKGKFPEINDIQLSLILTGVIATYYFDNKKLMDKLYHKFKEEGIFEVFIKVIEKTDELKNVFLKFIESLSLTLHKVTNMMSYTFVVPLIPILYNLAMNEITDEQVIGEILIRISGFGLMAISGVLLKELILKIIKRFRRKDK